MEEPTDLWFTSSSDDNDNEETFVGYCCLCGMRLCPLICKKVKIQRMFQQAANLGYGDKRCRDFCMEEVKVLLRRNNVPPCIMQVIVQNYHEKGD